MPDVDVETCADSEETSSVGRDEIMRLRSARPATVYFLSAGGNWEVENWRTKTASRMQVGETGIRLYISADLEMQLKAARSAPVAGPAVCPEESWADQPVVFPAAGQAAARNREAPEAVGRGHVRCPGRSCVLPLALCFLCLER